MTYLSFYNIQSHAVNFSTRCATHTAKVTGEGQVIPVN